MHRLGAAPSCHYLVIVCVETSVIRRTLSFNLIKRTVILIGVTVNNAIAAVYKSAVPQYILLYNMQLFICIFHLLQVYYIYMLQHVAKPLDRSKNTTLKNTVTVHKTA
jgi:hypothetical protein